MLSRVKAMWMMNALLRVRVQGVPRGEERVTVVARHRKEVVLQSAFRSPDAVINVCLHLRSLQCALRSLQCAFAETLGFVREHSITHGLMLSPKWAKAYLRGDKSTEITCADLDPKGARCGSLILLMCGHVSDQCVLVCV